MALARRALLSPGHFSAAAHETESMGHGHHHHGGAHEAAAADLDHLLGREPASTLDVRIIAMFAIAAGALLCGLPPLFLRAFRSPDAPAARISRAFSGGVILALALVHIVPEAVGELSEVVDFPVGGVAVLFGILALVVADSWLTAICAPEDYKRSVLNGQGTGLPTAGGLKSLSGGCSHSKQHQQSHGHSHSHQRGTAVARRGGSGGETNGSGKDTVRCESDGLDDTAANKDAAIVVAPTLVLHAHEGSPISSGSSSVDLQQEQQQQQNERQQQQQMQAHSHSCTSTLTPQRFLDGGGTPHGGVTGVGHQLVDVRRRVTAYTMELGCIFHSLIIGVGVGVITQDRRLVVVLMVALIVHQGLEGLSLGTVLALAPFSAAKKVAMVSLYAVTTSVGIAIGIAASGAYDPESKASRAVQGTLNGVSGGMLLYISMYQLIAEEFSREDLVTRSRLRAGMIAGLLLGAASMCILAIWS